MGFKLNLTGEEIKQAQGNNFEPLPSGIYGAVIYTAVQKQSKAKNEMFEIDFKITDGPAGINRRQRGWFVLSGKGLFKLIELNKATGFPYPDKTTPPGEFEFPDADEYLGIQVNIELDQQPYESIEDVEDEETGEVTEVEVTKYRNNLKKVTKYDESKHSLAEDVDESGAAVDSGSLFL